MTTNESGAPAADVPGTVTVRYWAGAAAAAGTETDLVTAATVGEAVDAAVALHPELARIAPVCALLLDGVRAKRHTPAPEGSTLELLPPFAGG